MAQASDRSSNSCSMTAMFVIDGLIEQAGLGRVKLPSAMAESAALRTATSCVSWSILIRPGFLDHGKR